MKLFYRAVGLAVLTLPIMACTAHFPLVIKIGDDIYMGEASASVGESGKYSVTNAKGMECHGEFESTLEMTSPATIICGDGRTGTLKIVRNPGRKSGMGQGVLNDGTVVRFSYGPTVTLMQMQMDKQ